MFESVLKNELLIQAAGACRPGRTARIVGVWGSSSALSAAAIGKITGRTVLFIAPHPDDADEVADDIEVFTGRPAHSFPAWEVDVAADHVNDEVVSERLRVCNLLCGASGESEKVEFIVAPVMALLQPVPTKEALAKSRYTISKGQALEPSRLIEWLVDGGYERVEQVDQQGEFAHRGGIVDIFPSGVREALRVEFFGDQVDSLRRFDLDTQRSTDQLNSYGLTAMTAGSDISAGGTNLLEYLGDDTIICMVEPAEVRELASQLYERMTDADTPAISAGLTKPEKLFAQLGRFGTVEFHTFAGRTAGGETIDLGVRSLERLAINTQEALEELRQLSDSAAVWIYCENEAEQARFLETLAASQPALRARANVAIGHVHSGFYWPNQHLAVVGHHEIFQRYSKIKRIRRVRAGRPIESLLDLSEGDYVVHVAHGIARFDGLQKIQRGERTEECLSLKFAGNAMLHVPVSQINLVQKYIGSRQFRPKLSTLGGTSWLKQKTKVTEAVKDMAAELLRIQAMREAAQGVQYPAVTDWQRQFADEFLYTETEDQLSTMVQIDQDMASVRPMDRLLCGDVGYGKTELAMRAAFKAAEAGKQAAVLVPTTVLAAQHYRSFKERFADYPITIDVISRFRKPSEQADILRRLAAGKIDILIGTHRLLSKDVKFKDLALAVIDEEQRFGVEHKERFKALRATVEMLTLTATPIPRTLHMALLGLRDISSLTTPPMDRRAIHTEVCHYDDKLIRQAILRELNRQGQVFFVHNRVNSIRPLAEHIRKLVPEARIAVGHGQMGERELERTMLRFIRGEIDVLVCTTIIESGLDIPSANTMIIHNADRFGLSELHQLRGRVGRYKHRAFCYLLLPQTRPVSPVAAKRLKAVEEFSDLGAGFQIAMRDLEIRGAGNILGPQQSGHIAAVGYELYCQLLERSVRELRGLPAPVHRDVHVELGLDVFIPPWYVPVERQRMEIYRRLARCSGSAELRQLESDLADAYGKVPDGVQTLLDVAEIRVCAAAAGIDSIIWMEPDLIFAVNDFTRAKKVFDGAAGSVRLPDNKTAHWRLPKTYAVMPTLVKVLLKRLRTACEHI